MDIKDPSKISRKPLMVACCSPRRSLSRWFDQHLSVGPGVLILDLSPWPLLLLLGFCDACLHHCLSMFPFKHIFSTSSIKLRPLHWSWLLCAIYNQYQSVNCGGQLLPGRIGVSGNQITKGRVIALSVRFQSLRRSLMLGAEAKNIPQSRKPLSTQGMPNFTGKTEVMICHDDNCDSFETNLHFKHSHWDGECYWIGKIYRKPWFQPCGCRSVVQPRRTEIHEEPRRCFGACTYVSMYVCMVLHCIALHCIVLFYIIEKYIILYWRYNMI